jgi:hypothetical protein
MEKNKKQIENLSSNEERKENTLLDDYKAMVKLLQKQKRLGLINKSEYSYLKALYLLNLTEH